jgi:hypothetical protein
MTLKLSMEAARVLQRRGIVWESVLRSSLMAVGDA